MEAELSSPDLQRLVDEYNEKNRYTGWLRPFTSYEYLKHYDYNQPHPLMTEENFQKFFRDEEEEGEEKPSGPKETKKATPEEKKDLLKRAVKSVTDKLL